MLTTILLATVTLAPPPVQPDPCITKPDHVAIEGRRSPIDSMTFTVGGTAIKVCYGRPAARGRTMLGERLAYGNLWRTGANEPTMIHTPVAITVAGVRLSPGTYSLYTVPGENEWTIILNASIDQWGHENSYTEAVRAMEVGRGTARASRSEQHVESFTIRAEPAGQRAATLVLEWEHTRVEVPVEVVG